MPSGSHDPAFKLELKKLIVAACNRETAPESIGDDDSLIGSDAVVSRTKRKPRAIRLMVGDHCQIDVE